MAVLSNAPVVCGRDAYRRTAVLTNPYNKAYSEQFVVSYSGPTELAQPLKFLSCKFLHSTPCPSTVHPECPARSYSWVHIAAGQQFSLARCTHSHSTSAMSDTSTLATSDIVHGSAALVACLPAPLAESHAVTCTAMAPSGFLQVPPSSCTRGMSLTIRNISKLKKRIAQLHL